MQEPLGSKFVALTRLLGMLGMEAYPAGNSLAKAA